MVPETDPPGLVSSLTPPLLQLSGGGINLQL